MKRIEYNNFPKNNEVHVWLGEFDEFSRNIALLSSCLSADEIERSERLRLPSLRDNFVTSRGLLRQLLGHYLGRAPAEVAIGYSDKGKPLLASPRLTTDLNFNLSHSGNALGYAITGGTPVGIDLEPLDRGAELDEIGGHYLNANEIQAIQFIPPRLRRERQLRYWTYKEALLKATGDGLGGGMQRLEIIFDDNGKPRLNLNESLADCRKDWTLLPVDAGPEYVTALVVACINPVVVYHRLTELLPQMLA